jgi:PAS domain S-box-containing protein
MVKDIVLISPFERMYETAIRIVKERSYDNIDVVSGDLAHGVMLAQQAVKDGTNVIISRGGTYSRICAAVNVPVVEIQITAFDVFNSIKNIRHIDQPIAIIGYRNVIQGYDVIKDFLKGQDIIKHTLDDNMPIEAQIRQCVDKGIKVFVGDSVVNSVIRKLGLVSFLIESGEEAIVNAIEEAIRVLCAIRIERERVQRFMAVIDNTSDGVIATDKESRINVFNVNAEKLLNITKKEVLGKPILEAIGDNSLSRIALTQQSKIDSIHSVGKGKLAINHIPIVVDNESMGSVITFQEITRIQNLERKIRIKLSEKGFTTRYTFEDIIYKSPLMERCICRARSFGRYDSSVLINGPSGVGKELFAQSIHNISNRASGPFVPINCAALPPSLIESELFGYVDGAFTGAKKGGKIGLFELAHGGTIFLDEISEMPLDLQGRLLRVIQEREVMRIGDDCVIPVNVRIICATNLDLREQVGKGKFRRDLLFRINVLALNIPPLDERREDIVPIAEHLVQNYCLKYNRHHMVLSKDALDYLKNLHYEGNVRELQGMIERAVIICDRDQIMAEDFEDVAVNLVEDNAHKSEFFAWEPTLRELENQYIKYICHKYNGVSGNICKILDIDRSTLWRKRKSDK